MSLVDKLSNTLAQFIVTGNRKSIEHEPIEGISKEIDELKELQLEIQSKDEEIRRRSVEWDKTFDSIGDNIVIIDIDGRITKVNKQFVQAVKDEGGSWTELIGMDWQYFHKIVMGVLSDTCAVSDCFETKIRQEKKLTHNGRTYHVSCSPIFDNHRNVIGVVRVSRDITKYEDQKKLLARRSDIFEAVAKISRTLTNHDNWELAIDEILKLLGSAVGAHRVYIFENTSRECRVCAELLSVWINPTSNVCPVGEKMTDCINYDIIPELRDSMIKGESVQTNITACDICPERDHCICNDDVIVSAVPIFSNKKWWGFIGFDYYNGHRKFKDKDETILRIAADILGGVIYRRKKYYDSLDNKD